MIDLVMFLIFWIYTKKNRKHLNIPIQTLVSKYENKVTLKIKQGYYLELLTPKTLKYLESKGNKMPKNVLQLQIT